MKYGEGGVGLQRDCSQSVVRDICTKVELSGMVCEIYRYIDWLTKGL